MVETHKYVIVRCEPTNIGADQMPGLYSVWQRPETGRGGVLISQHATEDSALEAKARYEAGDARRARRA